MGGRGEPVGVCEAGLAGGGGRSEPALAPPLGPAPPPWPGSAPPGHGVGRAAILGRALLWFVCMCVCVCVRVRAAPAPRGKRALDTPLRADAPPGEWGGRSRGRQSLGGGVRAAAGGGGGLEAPPAAGFNRPRPAARKVVARSFPRARTTHRWLLARSLARLESPPTGRSRKRSPGGGGSGARSASTSTWLTCGSRAPLQRARRLLRARPARSD